MRLEVPKFNGNDLKSWIFDIHEYFDLLGTADGFLESVRNRFGPCKYEDPQGALSKCLQTGTVAQYQSLKPALQKELLVSKPTTLGDAFSFTRVIEARLEDQWSSPSSSSNRASGISGGGQSQKAAPPHFPTIRLSVEVDLYVLPMKGPDVVLGIQWLQKLGKVTHDYAQQSMEFTLADKTYTLQGEASLRMKQMSLHRMQALLDTDKVYRVYKLHGVATPAEEAEETLVQAPKTPSEIERLLASFDILFQVPTTLPPHQIIDHRIHLLPYTKPVNVRPYRYPHYQKGKMEKLVNEMLSQGIIRFSQSPFSSPVLLVKKKDGSYRFCVDYRALNVVTVKDKFPIPTADEMFDELGVAVFYTKLDLQAGYHQIQ
nr:retrotransposon-related protein [Tanacetum cinerariifolium]GEZ48312.1 retrotransposon-related protein [Tanacetum cinerariifolium]GEZ48333.1 retrotransposon-related protein [Tanacetum cinerariifolium]